MSVSSRNVAGVKTRRSVPCSACMHRSPSASARCADARKKAVDLEPAESLRLKGQAIYSNQRRSSGVRVVGAALVSERDWALALHADGQVTLHSVSTLLGRGSLPVQGELLAFTTFTV